MQQVHLANLTNRFLHHSDNYYLVGTVTKGSSIRPGWATDSTGIWDNAYLRIEYTVLYRILIRILLECLG